jgi:hypothetical protein
MTTKRIFSGAVLGVLLLAGTANAVCIQDQYGGQYELTLDPAHLYAYGTADAVGCDATFYFLTGSVVPLAAGGFALEVTAANPLGDFDNECIATFKLKGQFPNFAWYYDDGYGGQEASWAGCAALIATQSTPPAGQGRRKR